MSPILLNNNLSGRRHRSSANGLSINNQTNLAIKGIIAIRAMSQMSTIVKQVADVKKYSVRADSLNVVWRD